MRAGAILLLGVCCLGYWLTAGSRAGAALPADGTMEEFRPAIETISNGVAKLLKSRRQSQITVGTISGPPTLGAAAGSGFRQMFIEELGRLGIRTAKLGTEIGLSGEYRLAKATPEALTTQIQFEVKLVDSSGQILTDLASTVDVNSLAGNSKIKPSGELVVNAFTTPEATALALGLTADLDGYQADINRGEYLSRDIVQTMLSRQTAHIMGSNQLRASKTSPYGLQVLVNGQPQPLQLENGRVFVELTKNDVFTLKLVNDSNLTIAGFFTLDGVNSFAFSEVQEQGRPKYAKWIISPQQSFDLQGWHKNNNNVLQFKVTDFAESAAALVGADGQLGTLSVVVRATWPMNSKPPPGEPAMPGAGAPDIGIGFGAQATQIVKEDSQVREYGRVRSILTIHYVRPE